MAMAPTATSGHHSGHGIRLASCHACTRSLRKTVVVVTAQPASVAAGAKAVEASACART